MNIIEKKDRRLSHLIFTDFLQKFQISITLNKKANKIRTNLLLFANNEFNEYKKKDNLKVNHLCIIDSEKKIEEMKSNLDNVKREIKNIYKCIDKLDIGYFTDMDLISYLKLKNFYISQIEAGLLFIRLDKDKDGKVTLWDLVYELNLKLN